MASYKEKEELANGFSWSDILAPGNFSKKSEVETPKFTITDWESPDGQVFRTFGEVEHLFPLVNGEPDFLHPVSKIDALRLFHFG